MLPTDRMDIQKIEVTEVKPKQSRRFSFKKISKVQRNIIEEHYAKVAEKKDEEFFDRLDPDLLDTRPEVAFDVAPLMRRLFPQPVDTLMDFGCGTGWYLPLLHNHANRIIGVDISQELIDLAHGVATKKNLGKVSFLHYDGYHLPFPDNSIDGVFEWDVMHHVDDLDQVIPEIFRVLKPGGSFIGMEPNVYNPLMSIYHYRREHEHGAFNTHRRNMKKMLKEQFPDVQIISNNVAISYNNAVYRKIISGINPFFTKVPLLKEFSLRYILKATKR